MEKALVLGGSYFIGKKIVDIMKMNGYEVYTLNRGTKSNPDGVKNILCDRNDRDKMSEVLKKYTFSVVIDVSGLDKTQSEILFHSISKDNLKKIVFISSSAVYDVENVMVPYKETDVLKSNIYWTSYGQNKIEAERYYSKAFSNTETELIILRPPYVYGENNYAQRESFIFEHVCNNKPIIIPCSNPRLQFIYTTDLANIIVKLLNIDLPKLSIFNVGNKSVLTAKQWVECCAKTVQKQAEIIMYDYLKDGRNVRDFFPLFDYDNVLDVSRINAIYETETDFELGLKKSFEWYVNNKNDIVFKENVTQNEIAILQSLNIQ